MLDPDVHTVHSDISYLVVHPHFHLVWYLPLPSERRHNRFPPCRYLVPDHPYDGPLEVIIDTVRRFPSCQDDFKSTDFRFSSKRLATPTLPEVTSIELVPTRLALKSRHTPTLQQPTPIHTPRQHHHSPRNVWTLHLTSVLAYTCCLDYC